MLCFLNLKNILGNTQNKWSLNKAANWAIKANNPKKILIINKFYLMFILKVCVGEGSTARNSSARKNCSTPKSRLLDTVRADDKNISICSKIKKVCRTCLVEHMHFQTKMCNCSNSNCSTKSMKNVNCSNLKKMKVWNMYGSSVKKKLKSLEHVRQFG